MRLRSETKEDNGLNYIVDYQSSLYASLDISFHVAYHMHAYLFSPLSLETKV